MYAVKPVRFKCLLASTHKSVLELENHLDKHKLNMYKVFASFLFNN